jgi:hypothetical protein
MIKSNPELFQNIIKLPRFVKIIILILADILSCIGAAWLALSLRLDYLIFLNEIKLSLVFFFCINLFTNILVF